MAQMTLAGQSAMPVHPLIADDLLPDLAWLETMIDDATEHITLDALDVVLTFLTLAQPYHPDRRYLREKISKKAGWLGLDSRLRLIRLQRIAFDRPVQAWYLDTAIEACQTTEQLEHIARVVKMIIPADDEELAQLRRIYTARKKALD